MKFPKINFGNVMKEDGAIALGAIGSEFIGVHLNIGSGTTAPLLNMAVRAGIGLVGPGLLKAKQGGFVANAAKGVIASVGISAAAYFVPSLFTPAAPPAPAATTTTSATSSAAVAGNGNLAYVGANGNLAYVGAGANPQRKMTSYGGYAG
jgi:hypothetical protein